MATRRSVDYYPLDPDINVFFPDIIDHYQEQREKCQFGVLMKVPYLQRVRFDQINGLDSSRPTWPGLNKVRNVITARPFSVIGPNKNQKTFHTEIILIYRMLNEDFIDPTHRFLFLYTWLFPCSHCAIAMKVAFAWIKSFHSRMDFRVAYTAGERNKDVYQFLADGVTSFSCKMFPCFLDNKNQNHSEDTLGIDPWLFFQITCSTYLYITPVTLQQALTEKSPFRLLDLFRRPNSTTFFIEFLENTKQRWENLRAIFLKLPKQLTRLNLHNCKNYKCLSTCLTGTELLTDLLQLLTAFLQWKKGSVENAKQCVEKRETNECKFFPALQSLFRTYCDTNPIQYNQDAYTVNQDVEQGSSIPDQFIKSSIHYAKIHHMPENPPKPTDTNAAVAPKPMKVYTSTNSVSYAQVVKTGLDSLGSGVKTISEYRRKWKQGINSYKPTTLEAALPKNYSNDELLEPITFSM